ncbi:MBL fold metallo-hydrolase [Halovivax gelatinilyticus]|uniref:MBL fold metallo-hydrolase n=1 Tax=Halovivax gelatinilyticus TaxID=2961597 RepID=UPI0020CA44EA|nr:MBL fold metallo-hydrolase [Halovivax gelatinilyticus]
MRVSFQNANVHRGNESTLLRVTTTDGRRACILVDAGPGVDVETLLDEDEYLNAILLTHAHIDHYLTLANNVTHGAPIYASPATAATLERALPEATKDNDVGPVSDALEALTPITEWTDVLPEVAVRPVPAGHAPGASGFVCRFRDEAATVSTDRHVLITGDFTRRSCAGYPGLPTQFPFEIDTVVCTVATNDAYESTLQTAVETILERAFAGSTVVVAAGSLAGVHLGSLIADVADRLDRPLPVELVGQAAKLADELDVVPSGLSTRPVFDDPAEILEPGSVTIAGPADPTRGSARRLFDAISDDDGALFVQSTPDDDATRSARCTIRTFDLSNHPAHETIVELVDELAPLQVIATHGGRSRLKRVQRDLDRCFVWGSADDAIHPLYDDGEWLEPAWIGEEAVRTIRDRHRQRLVESPPTTAVTFPTLDPGPVDLEDEGVEFDRLRTKFTPSIANPYGSSATADGGTLDSSCGPEAQPTGEFVAGESIATDDSAMMTDGKQSFESTVLDRLDAIEARLDESESVRARVLGGGPDRLLNPLDDVDLEPGEIVEISIERAAERADGEVERGADETQTDSTG